jgi:hypothetical protein
LDRIVGRLNYRWIVGRLNYRKFGTYFANGQNFVVMVGLVYALHLTIHISHNL